MSAGTKKLVIMLSTVVLISGCGHSHHKKHIASYRGDGTYVTKADQRPQYTEFRALQTKSTPAPESRRVAVASDSSRYNISLDEIRQHQRDGSAVIVDARSPDSFQKEHLRGAINLPAGQKESYIAQIHQEVAPEQLVIIYCSSAACDAGDRVYEYLSSQGYTNMRVYKPGWDRLAMSNVDREAGGDHG